MELTHTGPTRPSEHKSRQPWEAVSVLAKDGRAVCPRPTSVRADSLRIGVVGCGYWGAKHTRVLSSLSDVDEIALIEPNAHSRDTLAAAYPEAPTYSNLEAALPNVDAVIIATPPGTHADLALQALRSGKHVLVEKPLATTSREARLIVEEAGRSDRVLMVGHTFEFNPAVQELRWQVEQGDFGEVYYIHSSRFNVDLYRSDVNVIWDLAPHDISIMNYLLRSAPTAVTAWGPGSGHIDVAYARLDYGRVGGTGYVHVSWLDPKKTRQVTVVGRNKVAAYNDLDTEERVRIFDRTVEASAAAGPAGVGGAPAYGYGNSVAPCIDFKEPLAVEDQHFIDCIIEMAPPTADGVNGLAVVATLEAVERSLSSGKTVELDLPEHSGAYAVRMPRALEIAEAR